MSALVGQHQITTFTVPVNGATPIDANTVRGNDNTIKTAYDAHDSDTTIHVQSSTLAARPAASTAGQKWMTSDGFRLYYDDGAAWNEVAYLPSVGGTVGDGTAISGNGPPTPLGLLVSDATTAAATAVTGVYAQLKQTAANSSNVVALSGYGWASHTSGTVALLVGTAGNAEVSGNGGTTTAVSAISAGGGMVGTGATVTTWRAVHAFQPTNSGTVTTLIGISVAAMTAGATNYAIKTSTGQVLFGDTVAVTGDFAVNTNKFTVAAASGNTLVAGTLTVAGGIAAGATSSVAGTLNVSSDLAINTNKFNVTGSSGATAIASTLAVTGAVSVGNTLNVVSPTSPNRTITLVVGGTTVYVHCKTTND